MSSIHYKSYCIPLSNINYFEIASSRGKDRDSDRHGGGDRDRDRDRDRDKGRIEVIHPIVAATASVALWTVLHRSEQARALVRKEEGFGSALAMSLQDEAKRGSGSGSSIGSQSWTGRDANSGNERISNNTAVGARLNRCCSEINPVEITTTHARTALLHLMESN